MVAANREASWKQVWFDYLDSNALDAEKLRPGKMFAERYEDLEVDVSPGQIDMDVRSGPRMVYNVNFRAPQASGDAWQLFDKHIKVNPTMLGTATQGGLPVEAGEYARSGAIGVLPDWTSTTTECSCPASGDCKHVLALLYYLGEHFQNDPFELLRFLGRTREQFLDSVTSAITSHEYQPQSASDAWFATSAPLPQSPPPAESKGQLASWPTEPPQNAPFDGEGLKLLGQDALDRAWRVLSVGAPSALDLTETADLARRAGHQPFADSLVEHSGIPRARLLERAEIWRAYGEGGLLATINPTAVIDLDSSSQVRQAANGEWFEFSKRSDRWQIQAGPVGAPAPAQNELES